VTERRTLIRRQPFFGVGEVGSFTSFPCFDKYVPWTQRTHRGRVHHGTAASSDGFSEPSGNHSEPSSSTEDGKGSARTSASSS